VHVLFICEFLQASKRASTLRASTLHASTLQASTLQASTLRASKLTLLLLLMQMEAELVEVEAQSEQLQLEGQVRGDDATMYACLHVCMFNDCVLAIICCLGQYFCMEVGQGVCVGRCECDDQETTCASMHRTVLLWWCVP
jgi:hypothetical protein